MTCCQLAKITNSQVPISQTHHHHGFPVLFSRSLETLGEPYRTSNFPKSQVVQYRQRHSYTTVGPGYDDDHHALPWLGMRIELNMKATMKFPHTHGKLEGSCACAGPGRSWRFRVRVAVGSRKEAARAGGTVVTVGPGYDPLLHSL
jgi:hypothetical protein